MWCPAEDEEIAIVGGGLAGLCTALSLQAAGLRAAVYDASFHLSTIDVGINLLPHAVRELTELGLSYALERIAVEPRTLRYCDRWANEIRCERLGRTAGHAWPQISVRRPRLLEFLARAVRRRVGTTAIRFGISLRSFRIDETGVTMFLIDRRTNREFTRRAAGLVGADGLDSRVRQQLQPNEGPALRSGVSMYRGVTVARPPLDGTTILVAGDRPGMKFVAYPVSAPDRSGMVVVNWVLERAAPELVRPREIVPCAELLREIEGWHLSCIDMRGLISGSARIVEHPMVDRDPLPRWSFERATLLGDAAHPMYPMGMNGGSQSIIDGRVLASCLASASDVAEAFAAYDVERREAMNRLVVANRSCGPERVMVLVHEQAPSGFCRVEDVADVGQLDEVVRNYRRLAGFDVEFLASRPSWSTVPAAVAGFD